MGLGLLLVPALGGYWFLTHLYYTRYRAVRDSGYHILFRSAFVGGILFVIAEAVILSLNRYFPQLDAKWESYSPTPYSDTVVLSVLLGMVLPVVGNLFYGSARAARRTANDSGDLIELLIAESIEEQKPVEISLRSGKSYIGFALESGVARHGEPDVSIIPMASGYRDRDTQELEITTHYATVIQESLKQPSGISDLDFRVVIPITEIVSARVFHPRGI